MKKKNVGVYFFQNDLRIHDNYNLLLLSKKCEVIIPIYLVDFNNMNMNTLSFLYDSLNDLNTQLDYKLVYLYKEKDIFNYILNILSKDYKIVYFGFNNKKWFDLINFCFYNNIKYFCLENKRKTPFKLMDYKFEYMLFKEKKYRMLKLEKKGVLKGGRNNAIIQMSNNKDTFKLMPYIEFGCISINELNYFTKKTILINDNKPIFNEVYTDNPNDYDLFISCKTKDKKINEAMRQLIHTGVNNNILFNYSISTLHLNPHGQFGYYSILKKYAIMNDKVYI